MINLTEKLSNHFDWIFQIRWFFFLYPIFNYALLIWTSKYFI